MRILAFGSILALVQSAHAIGVGRPQTLSALGQPLHLLFPVSLSVGETLNPDCVRAEVLAGDTRLPSQSLQLQLEGESEASVRAVRLRSILQIDEPLVSVSLSLGCPARLVRQYTAFIDPPGDSPSQSPQPQAAAVVRHYSPQLQAALSTADARPAALLAPTVAPGTDLPRLAQSEPSGTAAGGAGSRAAPGADTIAPSRAQAEAPAKAERKPRLRPKTAAAAPGKAVGSAAVQQAKPASAPVSTGRLRLEPVEAPVAVVPASPSASLPASAASEPDAGAERLAKLEQGLLKLQSEQQRTLEQMQGMRSKLELAQAQRYQNPLVYGLGLLCLALAAAALYQWRARQRERQLDESAWWSDVKRELKPDVAGEATGGAVPPPAQSQVSSSLEPASPLVEQDEVQRTVALPELGTELEPAVAAGLPGAEPTLEPVTVQLIEPLQAPAPAPVREGRRVNVEELIDLEQQVEFFDVLGQDEAAVELLSERIDGAAATVALPYLLLLRLHRRAGRQQAFEALARRYAEQFGFPPPDWSTDMDAGGGIETHAELMALLQRRWSDSAACMGLLQALIVGRTENGAAAASPVPETALDLAALADLLMLYSVARDISEHEVRGEDIDLFLPLDAPRGAAAATGMMATMRWQAPAGALTAPHALEVDISLDDPTPTASG